MVHPATLPLLFFCAIIRPHMKSDSARYGIGFGTALAMVISYTNWHSIGWAILHGIFSWGYVIYYAIRY